MERNHPYGIKKSGEVKPLASGHTVKQSELLHARMKQNRAFCTGTRLKSYISGGKTSQETDWPIELSKP